MFSLFYVAWGGVLFSVQTTYHRTGHFNAGCRILSPMVASGAMTLPDAYSETSGQQNLVKIDAWEFQSCLLQKMSLKSENVLK